MSPVVLFCVTAVCLFVLSCHCILAARRVKCLGISKRRRPAHFPSHQVSPCKNNSVLLFGSAQRDVFGIPNVFLTCKIVWPRVWESWMLSSVPHRVPIFKRALVQMWESWERIISLLCHHKQQLGIIVSMFLKGWSPEHLDCCCCCHTLPADSSGQNVALVFADVLFRSLKHIVFKPTAMLGLRLHCYSRGRMEKISVLCDLTYPALVCCRVSSVRPSHQRSEPKATSWRHLKCTWSLYLLAYLFFFSNVSIMTVSMWRTSPALNEWWLLIIYLQMLGTNYILKKTDGDNPRYQGVHLTVTPWLLCQCSQSLHHRQKSK